MNRRWLGVTSAMLLAAAVGVLALALARWHAAGRTLERARGELAAVQRQASEIRSIRGELDTDRIGTNSSRAGALAEVADALTAAGLPAAAMRSLEERSDVADGDAGLHRQTLQLSLSSITPGELGRFLARLDAAHPEWRTTRVELSRARGSEGNRYDAGLTLARTYDAAARTQGEPRP